MTPTGDLVLNEDFAARWARIDNTNESSQAEHIVFVSLVRSIPHSVREELHRQWSCEYVPRDDGGRGHYVVDHLWYVWELRSEPLPKLMNGFNLSFDYLMALRDALRLDEIAKG